MAERKSYKELYEKLQHNQATMAGDFSAIASHLDRADIPENTDTVKRVGDLVDAFLALRDDRGQLVVTLKDGNCVAVTRQDKEGNVLKILWEKA